MHPFCSTVRKTLRRTNAGCQCRSKRPWPASPTSSDNQQNKNKPTMKTFLAFTAACGLALSSAVAADDIIDTAKSAGQFKTLTAALDAAGKTAMLKEAGPYTVFAPSDAAFEKLPKGTVEDLLKPENKEKLGKILAYHVVSGKVMAADVKTMMAKSANGAELDIKVKGDAVTVNNAKVVKADVKASNGVIHVIDTVLLPPTK